MYTLEKTKEEILVDTTRKCATCGSLALVGYNHCSDCGDYNIVPIINKSGNIK